MYETFTNVNTKNTLLFITKFCGVYLLIIDCRQSKKYQTKHIIIFIFPICDQYMFLIGQTKQIIDSHWPLWKKNGPQDQSNFWSAKKTIKCF